MPVTERGQSFQATVHYKGQRYRASFNTRSEAEAWEMSTKASLIRGETIQNPSTGGKHKQQETLKSLLDATYQRYWKNNKSGDKSYANASEVISLIGEEAHPSKVTTQVIDSLILQLEAKGNSDSTINRKLSALSKMMNYASSRDMIMRKPIIHRKKEAAHRIRYITEREEEVIMDYFQLTCPVMRDFCIVALDTGMRVSEVLNIKVQDVTDSMIAVWVNKSDRPRSIPMTDRVKEVVRRRLKTSNELFPTLNRDKVSHYWRKVRDFLKLNHDDQFVPHAMRHTFCSRLVQRGVDIVSVKELAGHSTIVVTMRYAHLNPNNLKDAINVLNGHAPQPQLVA